MNNAERERQRFEGCESLELLPGFIEQLLRHFAVKTCVTFAFSDGSRLAVELARQETHFRLNYAKSYEATRRRPPKANPLTAWNRGLKLSEAHKRHIGDSIAQRDPRIGDAAAQLARDRRDKENERD